MAAEEPASKRIKLETAGVPAEGGDGVPPAAADAGLEQDGQAPANGGEVGGEEAQAIAQADAQAAAARAAAAAAAAGAPEDPAAAAAAAGQLLQAQAAAGTVPLALDPSAAAALGLTPEQQAQMAQMQQLMPFPLALSPEALATLPAATGADGQPLPGLAGFPGLFGAGAELQQVTLDPAQLTGPVLLPDGTCVSSEQIMSMFGAGGMSLIIPAMPGMPGMPGTLGALPMLGGLPGLPGMEAVGAGAEGASGVKTWWAPHEEKELLQLVDDPAYRQEKLGCADVDWSKIASYFGARSSNAVRKKYGQLSKRADSDSEAMELTAVDPSKRPRADRKLWEGEETQELIKMVQDPTFRSQVLGIDEAAPEQEMWEAIANHFGCSVQTAKRKHRHLLEALQNGTLGQEKAKRVHHRKQTPYRWMIVQALQELPNFQGTAPDIFERIEACPTFADQLDHRIMPGTKHVPRWKIQVRKVLSADKIFQHTGLKQKHETVWRLDQHELQEAQATSRNAGRSASAAPTTHAAPPPAAFDPAQASADAAAAAAGGLAAHLDPSGANGLPGGGHVVMPADMAQIQMMQAQIAATIAAAPLVIPPDQLPQLSDLQHLPGAGALQPVDLATLHHMAAAQQQQQQAQDGAAGQAGEHGEAAGVPGGEGGGGQYHAQGGEGQAGDVHAVHDAAMLAQHQQLVQMGLAPLAPIDPAMLAAIAAMPAATSIPGADEGAAAGAAGAGAGGMDVAGLTLPMVHTVEVPAPLTDDPPEEHEEA